MADYILGLGGTTVSGQCKYCETCAPNAPCALNKPVILDSVIRSTEGYSFYAGAFGWGTNSPTGETVSGLPPGLTYASNITSGTFTTAGTYSTTITSTNACGTTTKVITFVIAHAYCALYLNTAGGDAGYDSTYDVTGDFTAARNITVDFESYTIKDQLLLYANGVLVYDSGCIGAHVTTTVLMPAGTTSARVVIVADCDGGTGTLWVLQINCA